MCSNCKGVGHDKPNCPSPGGAKHVPPQARDPKGKGKGKGKDGKGKGKGKGKSNYFSGKGSGHVSMLDGKWYDAEGYSEADWHAWSNQHQQQQQQHVAAALTDPPIDTMNATPWLG